MSVTFRSVVLIRSSMSCGLAVGMSSRANWFLGGLSEADHAKVERHLQPVEFKLGQILCEPGQDLDAVWFFRTGMSSDVYVLEDGFEVEACAFGYESAFGLGSAVGPACSVTRDLCQVPGDGWRLSAAAFRAAVATSPEMLRLVLKHTEAMAGFMARSIACNARHNLQARLARWLLTASDHAEEARRVATTHEFLAVMNGVQRTTVTEQLGAFEDAGLVELGRGSVSVRRREGLESRACGCYQATKDTWEALRPGSSISPSGV